MFVLLETHEQTFITCNDRGIPTVSVWFTLVNGNYYRQERTVSPGDWGAISFPVQQAANAPDMWITFQSDKWRLQSHLHLRHSLQTQMFMFTNWCTYLLVLESTKIYLTLWRHSMLPHHCAWFITTYSYGRKNPQHAFLRRGSKRTCPMSQFCGM
jgi:hypothetical protein